MFSQQGTEQLSTYTRCSHNHCYYCCCWSCCCHSWSLSFCVLCLASGFATCLPACIYCRMAARCFTKVRIQFCSTLLIYCNHLHAFEGRNLWCCFTIIAMLDYLNILAFCCLCFGFCCILHIDYFCKLRNIEKVHVLVRQLAC